MVLKAKGININPMMQTLKYNERIVLRKEVIHDKHQIASMIHQSWGGILEPSVSKINEDMTDDEKLYFDDDGYLIHQYKTVEKFENDRALEVAKKYFKL
jgi:hypothetical protein